MARRIRAREVLRLRSVNELSQNAIARTAHVSKHSVQDLLEAARERGVFWENVEGMSKEAAEAMPFSGRSTPAPDLDRVHRELARTCFTFKLLYAEFVERSEKRCCQAHGHRQDPPRLHARKGRLL